jgi:hypothetical protein
LENFFDWENAQVLNYKDVMKNSSASMTPNISLKTHMKKENYLLILKPIKIGIGYEGVIMTYEKIEGEWKVVASTR